MGGSNYTYAQYLLTAFRDTLTQAGIGRRLVMSSLLFDSNSFHGSRGQEINMAEKLEAGVVSRRGVFGLFGLAVATAIAVPATMLTVAEAEARVGNPASAASVAGMNRRDRRRDRRSKKKK
jgi:hypothetical protein